jgi:hypothetical protein
LIEAEIEAIAKSLVLKTEARNFEQKDTGLGPVEPASLGRNGNFHAKPS